MSPIPIEADSPPQSRTFMRRYAGAPLPWIKPVIVVIGIFYHYPVIDDFRISFTNYTLFGDNQDYTQGSITN
ncbi:sugar ABC transporter permease, partial [Rhizobium ruizarguesonis]